VLDLVAHTSLKTPTAVADFILHRNLNYESQMMNLGLETKNIALRIMKEKESRLQQVAQLIDFQLKSNFRRQAQMLDYIENELPSILRNRFSNAYAQLDNFEKIVRLLGPEAAFQRGFAMVFKQGKHVTEVAQLGPGDEVQVQLKKGKFQATVKNIEK
jgi:exodeoxyribonuclease VII large subunit